MKSLSYRVYCRISILLSSIVLILLLCGVFALKSDHITWTLDASFVILVCKSMFGFRIGYYSARGKTEAYDERDRLLLAKASQKAIIFSSFSTIVLLFIFLPLTAFGVVSSMAGWILAIVAIILPSSLQNVFFLRLDKTDDGDALY